MQPVLCISNKVLTVVQTSCEAESYPSFKLFSTCTPTYLYKSSSSPWYLSTSLETALLMKWIIMVSHLSPFEVTHNAILLRQCQSLISKDIATGTLYNKYNMNLITFLCQVVMQILTHLLQIKFHSSWYFQLFHVARYKTIINWNN